MKKKIITSLVALAVLITGFALAQRPTTSSFGQEHPKFLIFKDLSAEQIADLQTKRMQLALNLSVEQHTKVYAVALKFSEKMKNSAKELKTEQGKPSPETMYKIQLKKLELLQEVKLELKGILSDEQLATWLLIMIGK